MTARKRLKRKHVPLISIEASFVLLGAATLVIVALPITEWVLSSLVLDVSVLLYAIYTSRKVIR